MASSGEAASLFVEAARTLIIAHGGTDAAASAAHASAGRSRGAGMHKLAGEWDHMAEAIHQIAAVPRQIVWDVTKAR